MSVNVLMVPIPPMKNKYIVDSYALFSYTCNRQRLHVVICLIFEVERKNFIQYQFIFFSIVHEIIDNVDCVFMWNSHPIL
jgi:hypothetical protein